MPQSQTHTIVCPRPLRTAPPTRHRTPSLSTRRPSPPPLETSALDEFLTILSHSPCPSPPILLPPSRADSRGSRRHRRRGSTASARSAGSQEMGTQGVIPYSPPSRAHTRNPLPRHVDYALLAAKLHEMRFETESAPAFYGVAQYEVDVRREAALVEGGGAEEEKAVAMEGFEGEDVRQEGEEGGEGKEEKGEKGKETPRA